MWEAATAGLGAGEHAAAGERIAGAALTAGEGGGASVGHMDFFFRAHDTPSFHQLQTSPRGPGPLPWLLGPRFSVWSGERGGFNLLSSELAFAAHRDCSSGGPTATATFFYFLSSPSQFSAPTSLPLPPLLYLHLFMPSWGPSASFAFLPSRDGKMSDDENDNGLLSAKSPAPIERRDRGFEHADLQPSACCFPAEQLHPALTSRRF